MLFYFKKLFFASLFFFCINVYALDNYRAVYKLEVRGVSAGTIVHEGFFTDITYRIDTVGKPSVTATMLGYGETRESVKGLLQKDKVYPQTYQRSMEGKASYYLNYHFNPDKKEIEIKQGSDTKKINYEGDQFPLDSLSMIIQSLIDIQNNNITNEYNILLEDSIRSYQVRKMPDQKWETRKGVSFPVSVYKQTNGGRETIVYFANNPLRLLRLEQYRKGERRFSMSLTDYRILQK